MAQHFGSSTWANEPPSEEEQFKVQQERTLMRAVVADDAGEVKNVLAQQAAVIDINVKMSGGSTVLHHAAGKGNVEIMQLLRKQGADVDIQNAICMTPLMMACLNGNEKAIKFLVSEGADKGVKNTRGMSAKDILGERHPNISL
jgi:ankyrin repeat protein